MAKKKFKDEAEEIKTRQGASDITEDIIQISDKFLKIAKLSDNVAEKASISNIINVLSDYRIYYG